MPETPAGPIKQLPSGANPLALLEAGLRPSSSPAPDWAAISLEEVAFMLPAYDPQRQIGSGGMGVVFQAIQRDLQRRVAIKLLSPALLEKPGLATRFRHESRLMASLQHPGIVQVYEAGETPEGHLYYVMEFVDGEDLATRMKRGRLPADEAAVLILQVAEALEASHQLGIIHRDVKPANIFLTDGGPPRLGDFGLALTAEQAADPLRLTRAGTTVGTVEYAAPEQLARGRAVSAASDVYSLGVLAYEIFTGELPRGNFDPPSVRNPAVDAAFDGVLLRALQSDPSRRYADAGEFRKAFLYAADRERQETLRRQAMRRKLLRWGWLAGALAVVTLITSGSAVMAWRARHEAEERRAAAEAADKRTAGLIQFLLTDLRERLEPTGNLGAMDVVLAKAVDHFRRERADAGQSPETALKLADVLVTKADVIGVRGMNAEADALYSEAITLSRAARDAAPGMESRTIHAIEKIQDRSEHRMATGRYHEAKADAEIMVAEAQAHGKAHPGAKATRLLATAHRTLANALGYTEQLDEARAEYLKGKQLLADLLAATPGDKILASDVADYCVSLGSNAEARGDFASMLHYFTAWHDSVKERYGEGTMYSHAAFRMGVAFQKLERPAEALPYLKKAVSVAERDAAAEPGHKGRINHAFWCLHWLAEVHESLGNSQEAAEVRRREGEANAQLSAKPMTGKNNLEAQLASLHADPEANREKWWALCHNVQRAAAPLRDPAAAREFYAQWIRQAEEKAAKSEARTLAPVLPAFLHNRLATLWLQEDPARSGEHARQAIALREALVLACPQELELPWDALSSACHAAAAAAAGEREEALDAALEKMAASARQIPVEALAIQKNREFFPGRCASLLQTAQIRWPARRDACARIGREIAASLFDRGPAHSGNATLRAKLENLGK